MTDPDQPLFIDVDPETSAQAARAAVLTALVDRMLPLLDAYAQVDPASGGPHPSDLVDGDDGPTLAEIVEARRLLSQDPTPEDTEGFALGPIDDLDEPDPDLNEDAPPPSGDPLLDAARAFARSDEAFRAHKIAGLPVETAERAALEARQALVAAARADASDPDTQT